MYAYIDSFRKFGKTNTDNQSIKIKRPYPKRDGAAIESEAGYSQLRILWKSYFSGLAT